MTPMASVSSWEEPPIRAFHLRSPSVTATRMVELRGELMKRAVLMLVTLMALVTGLGQRARAETAETGPQLGDKGHLAISADRLFGYVHPRQTITQNGTSATSSGDIFSLLGNPRRDRLFLPADRFRPVRRAGIFGRRGGELLPHLPGHQPHRQCHR